MRYDLDTAVSAELYLESYDMVSSLADIGTSLYLDWQNIIGLWPLFGPFELLIK